MLALFLLVAPLMANANNPQAMSLKDAVTTALEKSPAFDTLKRQVDISELQEKSAFAKMFPSLDLTATHGLLDENPRAAITEPWTSQFNLGLTETLYDNGVSLTEYEISKLRKAQAEVEFRNQRNKLCLDVASAFLTYSLNTKLLDIQKAQFNRVREQYDLIANYYHQGVKTRKDFLRFKTEVNRGEIDLVSSKNSIEKSRQDLLRLLGANEDIAFVPLNLEDVKDEELKPPQKIEKHLVFESATLQNKISDLQADIVKRKYWPELFLTAGANYQSFQYLGTNTSFADNDRTGWNVLLTLKYNLWDWGIRSRDRQLAAHQNTISHNEQEARVLETKSQINKLALDMDQLRKNFKLSKELLSLEQTNLSLIQLEYRSGKAGYLDLITGFNQLADAQIKYYSSLSQLRTAQYSYLYNQGTLYDVISK